VSDVNAPFKPVDNPAEVAAVMAEIGVRARRAMRELALAPEGK
jgi:hypothetical protein